ncbi:hypothetical protein V6N11_048293 [Hibiscus sabdariffa]|uniref:Uncharacterized protein n=1 Tax=Hibiscus sabdariffa TaxID=183260 RepID=A0ABR2PUT9_9ROSI
MEGGSNSTSCMMDFGHNNTSDGLCPMSMMPPMTSYHHHHHSNLDSNPLFLSSIGSSMILDDHNNTGCHFMETSNSHGCSIKAKITAHPHYQRLLGAYVNCQKVGAPPEVVARLEEASAVATVGATSSGSIGEDPALDQFMEAYCEMLTKYEQELAKPFKETMLFLQRIDNQFKALTVSSSSSACGEAFDRNGSSEEEIDANGDFIDPLAEDGELKGQLLRKYSGYLGSLKQEFMKKKKKKGKLPKEARQQLLDWWSRHYKWPYPSESQKLDLAESTGLDPKQINNWFINQRKRHWKPSEDMPFVTMKSNAAIYDVHFISESYSITPIMHRKTKMNKKALAILMRARMRPNHHTNFPLPPISNDVNQLLSNSNSQGTQSGSNGHENGKLNNQRSFEAVRESMHSAISMHKTEVLDSVLNDFSEGYFSLSFENRRKLLLTLAKEYDLNRTQVRELIKQYLGLQPPGNEAQSGVVEDECSLATFYRIERNLRHSLKPVYETLFERINSHPEGLKFLTILRADILSVLVEGNIASLRAMDSNLKDKLSTWLSPAALELHQITWDDPASLLEKIVAYEAVHPISNLIDLKRRLGVGRRCFAYFHSAIPCEPLIFIEVALLKNIAETIQEVLWDHPPIAESEAACALFYSISSTQPGLAGINLGKFLIKRVITLVKRDMPHISVFATLSPIPGFMPWLLSKLASQSRLAEAENVSCSSADNPGLTFYENVLEPEEERALIDSLGDLAAGKSGMEILLNVLTPTTHEWTDSDKLLSALKPPLMRLCTRYLLQEKKRGKALDSVANFHLQNGAMVQRINWMANRSEKGLSQSAGIMVNYVYRTENIEEYAQSYFSKGHIQSSDEVKQYTQPLTKNESKDSLG